MLFLLSIDLVTGMTNQIIEKKRTKRNKRNL
nr:MAG TPA: hypothetical protein [Caudoviricetes sp.]